MHKMKFRKHQKGAPRPTHELYTPISQYGLYNRNSINIPKLIQKTHCFLIKHGYSIDFKSPITVTG